MALFASLYALPNGALTPGTREGRDARTPVLAHFVGS
jgi:hypothetical protein